MNTVFSQRVVRKIWMNIGMCFLYVPLFCQVVKIDSSEHSIIKGLEGSIGISSSIGNFFLEIHSQERELAVEYGLNYQLERKDYALNFFTRYTRHLIDEKGVYKVRNRLTPDPFDQIDLEGIETIDVGFIDAGFEVFHKPLSLDKFDPYISVGLKGIIKTHESFQYSLYPPDHNYRIFADNYKHAIGCNVGAGISYNISVNWMLNVQYEYSRNLTDININDGTKYDRSMARVILYRKIH